MLVTCEFKAAARAESKRSYGIIVMGGMSLREKVYRGSPLSPKTHASAGKFSDSTVPRKVYESGTMNKAFEFEVNFGEDGKPVECPGIKALDRKVEETSLMKWLEYISIAEAVVIRLGGLILVAIFIGKAILHEFAK